MFGHWVLTAPSLPVQCQLLLLMGLYFWDQALGTVVLPPGQAHSRVETLSEVGGLLACSFRATRVTVYSSPGFSPVWLKVVTLLGSWAITPPSLFCQGMKPALTLSHQLVLHGEEVPPILPRPTLHPQITLSPWHTPPWRKKAGMKSPSKPGVLVLLGCKILPIPPPSPASVFCHLCLCCSPEQERRLNQSLG